MKFIFTTLMVLALFSPAHAQKKKTKVKVKHKICKSMSDLGEAFKTCKPMKCGDRRIYGVRKGKCAFIENIELKMSKKTIKSQVKCRYPKSYWNALAKMYGASSGKSEQKTVSDFMNMTPEERDAAAAKQKSKGTYTIDGEETANPITLATQKGHCKQTFDGI